MPSPSLAAGGVEFRHHDTQRISRISVVLLVCSAEPSVQTGLSSGQPTAQPRKYYARSAKPVRNQVSRGLGKRFGGSGWAQINTLDSQ